MPRFVRASAPRTVGDDWLTELAEGGLMFTGIVTGLGTVREIVPLGARR